MYGQPSTDHYRDDLRYETAQEPGQRISKTKTVEKPEHWENNADKLVRDKLRYFDWESKHGREVMAERDPEYFYTVVDPRDHYDLIAHDPRPRDPEEHLRGIKESIRMGGKHLRDGG